MCTHTTAVVILACLCVHQESALSRMGVVNLTVWFININNDVCVYFIFYFLILEFISLLFHTTVVAFTCIQDDRNNILYYNIVTRKRILLKRNRMHFLTFLYIFNT